MLHPSPVLPVPAGSLHPGTHTLNSSNLGSNMNNNNNSPNGNLNGNNGTDVEYRVTVKQKKKQTAACDACKRRRRKCSGTQPCAYCTEKRCECNYSQQHKRGKRKATDIVNESPSPPDHNGQVTQVYNLAKAHKLWNETERYSVVDKFCGIRWWWKNLLDMQAIKQSPTPAHRAQSSVINAWMARVARDHAAARHHYDVARNIALNGFNDSDPAAITTAYLLLSDYAPSEKEYIHYSWKSAARIKPGTSTERHVYFYAKCFHSCSDDHTSYSERLEKLLSFGSEALQSSVVDLWDTVFFMSVKAYVALMSKLESFLDIRTISNLSLPKADRDGLMMDLRVGEVLMQSQIHMFGFEYQTCLHFTKIMLLWAGGERERAVQEAIRYVQNIEQYGENALFLVEVKNMMMPLMILNEAGITTYNNTTVDIIETICKETDQPDMLTELLPLFNELRIAGAPAPSHAHTSPLTHRPAPSPLSAHPSTHPSTHSPTPSPPHPSSSSSSSTSTPPLSSPSSCGSPNDSPLIEEVPEHILLENAAAQEFFASSTGVFGYPAPRNLLAPASPPSHPPPAPSFHSLSSAPHPSSHPSFHPSPASPPHPSSAPSFHPSSASPPHPSSAPSFPPAPATYSHTSSTPSHTSRPVASPPPHSSSTPSYPSPPLPRNPSQPPSYSYSDPAPAPSLSPSPSPSSSSSHPIPPHYTPPFNQHIPPNLHHNHPLLNTSSVHPFYPSSSPSPSSSSSTSSFSLPSSSSPASASTFSLPPSSTLAPSTSSTFSLPPSSSLNPPSTTFSSSFTLPPSSSLAPSPLLPPLSNRAPLNPTPAASSSLPFFPLPPTQVTYDLNWDTPQNLTPSTPNTTTFSPPPSYAELLLSDPNSPLPL